jgi:outer membrane protein assembly factor BamD
VTPHRLRSRNPTSSVLAFSLSAVVVTGALSSTGCKGFETNLQDTDVDYQTTARQNYEAGDAAFKDGEYNDAIKYFEYVKNKYPYSKYAVLADLRTADAHYEREEWLQAADAYRLFVRYHPSHESVPYASYRIALAYYEETAKDPLGDVWLVGPVLSFLSPIPKAEERDQTATRDAIQAFDDYLNRFPDDENVEQAKSMRQKAREKLASSDISAAKFYTARNKHRGAMWRYLHVADKYSDTSLAPDALLRAANIAIDELDEPETAEPLLLRITSGYKESDEAKDAAKLLEKVQKKIADKKLAAEKAAEAKRIAAEKAAEAKRIADEKSAAEKSAVDDDKSDDDDKTIGAPNEAALE